MTTTPKTWDYLGAVEAALRGITQQAGFYTDAGLYVTREPAKEPGDDGLPVLCVFLDATDRPQDPALKRVGRQVSVMVVGKIPHDFDQAQLTQHQLLDDIERALESSSALSTLFPAGLQAPLWQESRFINRVAGIPWVGVAARYAAHITRK